MITSINMHGVVRVTQRPTRIMSDGMGFVTKFVFTGEDGTSVEVCAFHDAPLDVFHPEGGAV